jgi:transcription termination/antitermination protein NusG
MQGLFTSLGDGSGSCVSDCPPVPSVAARVMPAVAPVGACQRSYWYAVATRSRHEKAAAQELATKGVHHFLPLIPQRRRWSDRCVTVHEPLFPGYVLVNMVHSNCEQRVSVLECRSVVGFVGDGKTAWSIADAEVSSVRAIVDSRLEFSPYPYLREGSFVEVIRGPLAGTSGILLCEPKRHRLVVSISLFARSVSVEVDVADVRPCDA